MRAATRTVATIRSVFFASYPFPYRIALIAFFAVCWLPCLSAQQASSLHDVGPSERAQAEEWLQSLTLRQRIAQLMILPIYGDFPFAGSAADKQYLAAIDIIEAGGLIILNRVQDGGVVRAEPYRMTAFLNRMQRRSRLPLLVAGDFERGPSMRLNGVTTFPHAMAFGAADDLELTRRFGEATACEARALGVHWVLAPSADLNSNPDNPVIGARSFGSDPQAVATMAAAMIRGMQDGGERVRITACAKHFPGHGDTDLDSHLALPHLRHGFDRLHAKEWPPFRAAIDAGVASIMTAHIVFHAIDPLRPATLSPRVIDDVLRTQLRFRGAVISDDLRMGAVADLMPADELAVAAASAGCDLLLICADLEIQHAAISGLAKAITEGRLSSDRVEAALARVATLRRR